MAFEGDKRPNLDSVTAQEIGAAKFGQVDDERGAGQHRARPPDEPAGGQRGPPRGDKVVDEMDPRAGRAGIDVHRQAIGAIFERIILGDGLARQLPVLADEEEPGAEVKRDGRGEYEAARVDSRDQVRLVR